MEVKFANDDLARICTDEAHKLGLPVAVIRAARKTLIKLEAATFESDLFNLGGLDYKVLKGNGNDTRQVRVNKQYRIQFTVVGEGTGAIATITFIGDPH
ncbi:type II toxin-antitoxin system RelE/ParE family toxin [Martelella sp. AD-3]|uniref:type II toxin-antitoxin system RelE/ParE family toxin n=1 Tax=Martelella sp. AD-3 TaxID=686597 RepID=UPI001376C88E|nr:type II toxin-antitoxin system RelE/ParE family toxin [Martelella sp. AD-3]